MNKKTMELLVKAESMLGAYSSLIERSSAILADTKKERREIDRVSDGLYGLRHSTQEVDFSSAKTRTKLANAAGQLADYAWRLNQMALWASAVEYAPGSGKMADTFERMSNAADAVRAQLEDMLASGE